MFLSYRENIYLLYESIIFTVEYKHWYTFITETNKKTEMSLCSLPKQFYSILKISTLWYNFHVVTVCNIYKRCYVIDKTVT